VIAAALLVTLRVVHVATPIVFPSTRLGPIDVENLDDVRRLTGFVPAVPAYRPALLGDRPVNITVTLSPRPAFAIIWRAGGQYLSVTQRQGGSRPALSPLSVPLADVPDSAWWMDGESSHLVLQRGGFWIELETSLPRSELKRFADTLGPY
jgi:hypothetical protein